jgi:hypothetical protein
MKHIRIQSQIRCCTLQNICSDVTGLIITFEANTNSLNIKDAKHIFNLRDVRSNGRIILK